MSFIIVAFEGHMAVDTDEGRRFAIAKTMSLDLLLLKSDIAVAAHKGHHC